jgi:ketosteroid isomerase-like protein
LIGRIVIRISAMQNCGIAFPSKPRISRCNQKRSARRMSPMTRRVCPLRDSGCLHVNSGKTTMTEHSLWRFSRALHRALNERQLEDLQAVIDDDVDWAIYGPIDMFPFLGARRGKEAVLEVVRQIAENVRVHRFDRETIMLGVDSAASMLRYSLTALDSDKPISLRVAHFAQFKAGRLRSIRVLIDSFDLVEQALGHSIHLPRLTSFA